MKQIIYLLSVTLIFSSCDIKKDSSIFDSEKLKGKYKVDLTPFVAEAIKTEKEDDGWAKMGKGLAGLALSSVDIEFSFYDANKGVMHMDGGLIDFASAFSDEPVEKLHEFTYKVENDSILYMKGEKETEFKKWAIVRTFSENYDYLQFLIIEKGKDKVFFNLKKVGE